jgi:hypothetical protein
MGVQKWGGRNNHVIIKAFLVANTLKVLEIESRRLLSGKQFDVSVKYLRGGLKRDAKQMVQLGLFLRFCSRFMASSESISPSRPRALEH